MSGRNQNISIDYSYSKGKQVQLLSLSASVFDGRYVLTASSVEQRISSNLVVSGTLKSNGVIAYGTHLVLSSSVGSVIAISGNLFVTGNLGVGTSSPLGQMELETSGQPTMYWTDTTGGSNNKSGRIVFDGGVGLTTPGWVFQDVNDAGTFQANRVTISRAGKIGIGAGAVNPSASLEISGNAKFAWIGGNGSNGYGDYGLWVSTTSSINSHQNTLGVESHGDIYNNLNLWSNVSGNRRGWHISKRLQTEGNILQFYYYDTGAFTSVLTLSGNQSLGIGMVPVTPFDMTATYAGPIAQFFNDGNSINNWGLMVRCGEDTPAGTNVFFEAREGDNAATGRLQTNGAGVFALADVSDIRRKADIAPTQLDALDVIRRLEVIEYYRAKGEHRYQKNLCGFSAQNCQEVFPQMVTEGNDGLLMTMKAELIPVLVKAIQELSVKVSLLEAELNTLKNQ